jgi:tetratricopeptide (TPR) repeat protein
MQFNSDLVNRLITIRLSFLILLVLSIVPKSYYSQSDKKLDSLYQKFIHHKTDTIKVNLLFKYTNALIEARKYNEARLQAEELNHLANKVKHPLAEAYYEHLLGRIESFSNKYDLALTHLDKAATVYLKNNYYYGYFRCLLGMGNMYFYQMKNDKAIQTFEEIVKNQTKVKDDNIVGQAYSKMGAVFSQQGDNVKALEYLQKGIPFYNKTNNLKLVANNYNNISALYYSTKEVEKAIEYAYKALKINEKLGNEFNLANNYMNIGLQLMEFKRMDEAEEMYFKAIELGKKINDDRILAVTYSNIGTLYGKKKDFKKSL